MSWDSSYYMFAVSIVRSQRFGCQICEAQRFKCQRCKFLSLARRRLGEHERRHPWQTRRDSGAGRAQRGVDTRATLRGRQHPR